MRSSRRALELLTVSGIGRCYCPAVGPDRVKAQLQRVLTSPQFSKAERLGRFLRVIVEESLEGHAGALKEHRIGVDVYERGAAFDPRIDPIVRVQAAKLRAKLDRKSTRLNSSHLGISYA